MMKPRTIVVNQCADKSVLLQHGECLEGLTLAHQVGGLHVLLSGEQVVHLTAHPVVGYLPISDGGSAEGTHESSM